MCQNGWQSKCDYVLVDVLSLCQSLPRLIEHFDFIDKYMQASHTRLVTAACSCGTFFHWTISDSDTGEFRFETLLAVRLTVSRVIFGALIRFDYF